MPTAQAKNRKRVCLANAISRTENENSQQVTKYKRNSGISAKFKVCTFVK